MSQRFIFAMVLGAVIGTNTLQAFGITVPQIGQAVEEQESAEEFAYASALLYSDLMKLLEECQDGYAQCKQACP